MENKAYFVPLICLRKVQYITLMQLEIIFKSDINKLKANRRYSEIRCDYS